MDSKPIKITIAFTLLFHASLASQYYFDYSDCPCWNITATQDPCVILYNFDLGQYGDFQTLCVDSDVRCLQSAGKYAVCLRPDHPPVGGEILWPTYKQRFPPPTPKPQPFCGTHPTYPLYASITFNGILLLTLICAALYKRRLSTSGESNPLASPNASPTSSLVTVNIE